MLRNIVEFIEDKLDGHINIGKLTVYGANAMHWGVTYHTKKWGYICFRLPLRCFGRWWPLYFYLSPNATPWTSTFMLGMKHDRDDWALSRVRRRVFGHNFNVWDDEVYRRLRKINDSI